MNQADVIWNDPTEAVRHDAGDGPLMLFAPDMLQRTARRFQAGFEGFVTYAVKANPEPSVIANLAAAGVSAFDVASVEEMTLIRRLVPGAALHYNNPVRSRAEIRRAVNLGVASYSVDDAGELAKLVAEVPPAGVEVAVRFKLPVSGAAYDFGEKFGATPQEAAPLLRAVAQAGFTPSLTFHPGTQCPDAHAWVSYIDAAATIAREAGVALARLNVGGGFPARRNLADVPQIEDILSAIARAARAAFGSARPALICEPGRAMVAEGHALVTHVKAIRESGAVFLDDGIYGALSEAPLMGTTDRIAALAPDGTPRSGPAQARVVFGPTCDSVDRLPGTPQLPADLTEGDALVFLGMGAYASVTATRFNGYGALRHATVRTLDG